MSSWRHWSFFGFFVCSGNLRTKNHWSNNPVTREKFHFLLFNLLKVFCGKHHDEKSFVRRSDEKSPSGFYDNDNKDFLKATTLKIENNFQTKASINLMQRFRIRLINQISCHSIQQQQQAYIYSSDYLLIAIFRIPPGWFHSMTLSFIARIRYNEWKNHRSWYCWTLRT